MANEIKIPYGEDEKIYGIIGKENYKKYKNKDYDGSPFMLLTNRRFYYSGEMYKKENDNWIKDKKSLKAVRIGDINKIEKKSCLLRKDIFNKVNNFYLTLIPFVLLFIVIKSFSKGFKFFILWLNIYFGSLVLIKHLRSYISKFFVESTDLLIVEYPRDIFGINTENLDSDQIEEFKKKIAKYSKKYSSFN